MKPFNIFFILSCLFLGACTIIPAGTPTPTPAPTQTPLTPITPTQNAARTSEPPVGSLPFVVESNGWVTYRNDIAGYEISAPQDYLVEGMLPEIGCDLLGPGVPCDALQNLLRQYYGDRLCVSIGKAQTPWFFGVEAYDIVQNHLQSWCFGTGVGDYELVNTEEPITVEGQDQKLTTTILVRDNVQVGEISFLLLQDDAIRIMFGFSPAYPEIPEDYQAYLKDVRPQLIQMIQTFKSIPIPELPANIGTPTPTSVSTLDAESVQKIIQPFLQDPMNCRGLCFWGIIPGTTTMDEAKAFFDHLGFQHREGIDIYTGDEFYSVGYKESFGPESNATLYTTGDLVESIEITPDIYFQRNVTPRVWISYSPETLIKKFGPPTRVQFAVDWGPNFVITMVLYFDDIHLIAEYSGYNMLPDRPKSPTLCPLTAPFDFTRLWMGPNAPHPPLFETVSLEIAASLTLDQFTELMLGNPQDACFPIYGEAFDYHDPE